jgi:hypothetical protein
MLGANNTKTGRNYFVAPNGGDNYSKALEKVIYTYPVIKIFL